MWFELADDKLLFFMTEHWSVKSAIRRNPQILSMKRHAFITMSVFFICFTVNFFEVVSNKTDLSRIIIPIFSHSSVYI